MNLPNKLTTARIFLTFIFILLLNQNGLFPIIAAAIVFTLASLTDLFDGYIAKKYNMVSDFGKLMDPIADKFLILAAFVVFVRMQIVEDWMFILILGREILITGMRIFALTKRKVLEAERAGKHKTVSQMMAIFVILVFLIAREYLTKMSHWTTDMEAIWGSGIYFLMLATVTLTLISGVSYLWSNRRLIHVQ